MNQHKSHEEDSYTRMRLYWLQDILIEVVSEVEA
jgi:hypothetical protein